MGYDKTPSRDRTILVTGVATVIMLLGLMPILRGYFYNMVEPLEQQRIDQSNGTAMLQAYRAEQQQSLTNIQQAVTAFGQGGRTGSPAVAPRRSESANVDAVEGWSETKNEAARRHAQWAFDRAQEARRLQELAAQADAGVAPTAPEGNR